MPSSPPKTIRVDIEDALIGFVDPIVRHVLPDYEVIIDADRPQIAIGANMRESHPFFEKNVLKGVPTLNCIDESLVPMAWGPIHAVVHNLARLSRLLPARWCRFLFRLIIVWPYEKGFRWRPDSVLPHHKEMVRYANRNISWQYHIITSPVWAGLERERVWSIPTSFCVYPQYLSYLERPFSRGNPAGRAFCVLASSNPCKTHMIRLYDELHTYKKVDFYGRTFLAPDGLLKGRDMHAIPLYKKYKFVISMENSCVENYISEKLIYGTLGGGIPIYWGAPNVSDYINPARFINSADYATLKELRERVKVLDSDPVAYESVISAPIFTEQNLENIRRLQTDLSEALRQVIAHAERSTPAENVANDPQITQ